MNGVAKRVHAMWGDESLIILTVVTDGRFP